MTSTSPPSKARNPVKRALEIAVAFELEKMKVAGSGFGLARRERQYLLGRSMDKMSREDRKHLTELVRVFEHPAETASRYRRFSYLLFSFAFLLIFTAGFSRLLKIDKWEGAILLVAGIVLGFGYFIDWRHGRFRF